MSQFVDTNIAVYAFLAGPKASRAMAALHGATISVQVLNEYANVGLRKLGYDLEKIEWHIESIRSSVAAIEPVIEQTHDMARAIVGRYKLNFYDAALIASALLADCDTFFSEDMQDGLIIEDQLTIRNPFA